MQRVLRTHGKPTYPEKTHCYENNPEKKHIS
jgi:hypothetical protein